MRYGFLFAALAALLFLGSPANAQNKRTQAPGYAQAVRQADGMTERVLDNIWENTDTYWHEGDYYRIVALLRIMMEGDPSFTEAYSNAAYLLWSLGDAKGADTTLQYGLSRTKRPWELHYELGWHLFNTKRYADALPYLKKGVNNPKADIIAYRILAHCYERLGRLDDSRKTWQSVVKKWPNDGAAKVNLTRVQAKMGAGE